MLGVPFGSGDEVDPDEWLSGLGELGLGDVLDPPAQDDDVGVEDLPIMSQPDTVDKRTQITREDKLLAGGARDRNANLVLVTRALVAAAANPGTTLTVPELARASNLSEATVTRILGSPEARELLLGACTEQIQLVIPKAIRALAGVLDDPGVPASVKIQASKVAFEGYKMLAEGAKKSVEAQSAEASMKFLSNLAQVAQRRRVTVEQVLP